MASDLQLTATTKDAAGHVLSGRAIIWIMTGLRASIRRTRPHLHTDPCGDDSEGPARASRWSSPELCVKVRGSSSMLLLGCLGDLLRFEKREIQVATFAPDRSSP